MMEIGLEDLGGIVYGVESMDQSIMVMTAGESSETAACAKEVVLSGFVISPTSKVSFFDEENTNSSIWPYQIQTIQYPRYPWYPILFNTIGLLRYFCKHIPWTKELFYSLLRNGEGSEILEIVSGSVFNNNSRWNCTLLRRT